MFEAIAVEQMVKARGKDALGSLSNSAKARLRGSGIVDSWLITDNELGKALQRPKCSEKNLHFKNIDAL